MSVLAIDIGGTAIKTGLFGADGAPISIGERPTNAKEGAAALIDRLCALVAEHGGVTGVGVSCSGQVDSRRGSIVFATQALPGMTGTPLRDILEQRLGLPVAIDNDVNCAAIGEAHYGAGRDLHDFICLTIGTGIGGAIVIDRKIYYGTHGISGEVGHMLIHAGADGVPCACGKRGCYEAYGSTTALIRRVETATGEHLDGRAIFARFSQPEIRAQIDGWLDEIVYGLVSLAHIFDTPCFILGGGILNEPYVLKELRTRFAQRAITSYSGAQIRRAEIGNNAGIYGAYYNACHQQAST